jgi:hypothetical protein
MASVFWNSKRFGELLKKIILLHDNTHTHKTNLMKVTLDMMGWEIMNQTP